MRELYTIKNRIIFRILHKSSFKSYLYSTLIGARYSGYTIEKAKEEAMKGFFKGFNMATEV